MPAQACPVDRQANYEQGQRTVFIDVAKGLSIVLVVLYHSRLGRWHPELMAALGLVRMPLFFFLAGLFFSYSQPAARLVTRKFDALLKPYLFTLCVAFLINAAVLGVPFEGDAVQLLYGTRLGKVWGPMWFLPHLFLVSIFAYLVHRNLQMARRSELFKWTVLLAMLISGGMLLGDGPRARHPLPHEDVVLLGLPWGTDLLLVSSPFFLAAGLLKDAVFRWRTPRPAVLAAALALFIFIAVWTDARIDLYRGVYSNPLLSSIAAVVGIYAVLTTARFLEFLPRVAQTLGFVGRGSLFILIFHRVTELALLRAVATLTPQPPTALLFALFLLSVAVPLGVRQIVLQTPLLSFFYLPRGRSAGGQSGEVSPIGLRPDARARDAG